MVKLVNSFIIAMVIVLEVPVSVLVPVFMVISLLYHIVLHYYNCTVNTTYWTNWEIERQIIGAEDTCSYITGVTNFLPQRKYIEKLSSEYVTVKRIRADVSQF